MDPSFWSFKLISRTSEVDINILANTLDVVWFHMSAYMSLMSLFYMSWKIICKIAAERNISVLNSDLKQNIYENPTHWQYKSNNTKKEHLNDFKCN